jgi:hypothetical protein
VGHQPDHPGHNCQAAEIKRLSTWFPIPLRLQTGLNKKGLLVADKNLIPFPEFAHHPFNSI